MDVCRSRTAALGQRYATAVQAAWSASVGTRPSGRTPLPAVAWANHTRSPAVMLEPLLAMHERDTAAGLPDAAWPPVYPKMPGEPPRVAPSRARKAPQPE